MLPPVAIYLKKCSSMEICFRAACPRKYWTTFRPAKRHTTTRSPYRPPVLSGMWSTRGMRPTEQAVPSRPRYLRRLNGRRRIAADARTFETIRYKRQAVNCQETLRTITIARGNRVEIQPAQYKMYVTRPFQVHLAVLCMCLFAQGCSSFRVPDEPLQPTPVTPVWDAQALYDHIRFLNRDDVHGRATGTQAYARAAAYVASRLSEYGLPPAVGGDFRTIYSAPINFPIGGRLRAVGLAGSGVFLAGVAAPRARRLDGAPASGATTRRQRPASILPSASSCCRGRKSPWLPGSDRARSWPFSSAPSALGSGSGRYAISSSCRSLQMRS